jgi:uncharacterized protein YoxC
MNSLLGGIFMRKKLFIYTLLLTLTLTLATPTALGASKTPTVAELQKKITALTKQVKDLTTKLNKNSKDIAAQKKKISELESKIKSKEQIISKKETEIESLNNEIESNKKESTEKALIIEDKTKSIEILSKASDIIYTDSNGNFVEESNTSIKWYVFKTEQANMYLTKSAIEKFGYILEISDNVIKDIAPYFNVKELPSKVSVFIWVEEPITKSVTGDYFARDDQIFINGGSEFHKTSIINTYIHELTHAFQDIVFRLFTHENYYQDVFFITEGMANYVTYHYFDYTKYNVPRDSNIYDKNNLSIRVDRAFQNLNLDKKKFTHLPPANIKKPWMDYSIYEGIIYYIEDIYGHQKMVQFIEYQKYLPISESVVKTYGVSEEQLVKDWKEYFGL